MKLSVFLLILVIMIGLPLSAGDYPRELKVYRGTTPKLDGIISPGEYNDAHHILGAQGQIWTEYMADPKQVEYRAYPRMTALSEVLWLSPKNKDFDDFMKRLRVHLERLSILDVNFEMPKED